MSTLGDWRSSRARRLLDAKSPAPVAAEVGERHAGVEGPRDGRDALEWVSRIEERAVVVDGVAHRMT